MFSMPSYPGKILGSTVSRVFTDLLSNSPKRSPRFSLGYEDTENMFYFLIINQNHLSNTDV